MLQVVTMQMMSDSGQDIYQIEWIHSNIDLRNC